MAALRALVRAALVGTTVVLAFAMPAPAAAASVPVTGWSSTAPTAVVEDTLETTDCPVVVPPEHAERITCGVLTVPERRAAGSDPERTLSLPVAIIASTSRDPASDPLVYPTNGGPGQASLTSLGYFLEYADWASDERDIILIAQRGSALADPSLDCPELDSAHFIIDGKRLSGADRDARYERQLAACRDRLIAEGVDLAAYTSAESAADLADLRTALEYDEWNLYGMSYGSRLALTTMRDRPEGLRAVILDGVYPPHINAYEETPAALLAAIDTLFAECAADSECSDQYPDLDESLSAALDRAAETPFSVTVKHPVDRSPVAVEVNDTDLLGGLFDALYDPNVVRVLPYLIDRLARGDVEAVTTLAQQNIDYADQTAEGLYLSVECAEEAPFNDDTRIAAALEADPLLDHYAIHDRFREDCAAWGVATLPATENAPVASGIPTLLTSGGFDPVTPRAWSEAAAEHLSVPYVFHFPRMGHGAVAGSWFDDCAASIAQQFLRDPVTPPDASCIDATPAVDFVTAADIRPTSAIDRLNSDVVQDRDPLQIALLGFTIIVFVSTLVYGAVYGLVWLRHRRGDAPGGSVLAAVTSAGLNLAYLGGLLFVLLNTDPLILRFGLPTGVWPLLIVPFAAIGAAILLVVLLVLAWMRDEGTTGHRIALSVSALASMVFALWLLARGLLML